MFWQRPAEPGAAFWFCAGTHAQAVMRLVDTLFPAGSLVVVAVGATTKFPSSCFNQTTSRGTERRDPQRKPALFAGSARVKPKENSASLDWLTPSEDKSSKDLFGDACLPGGHKMGTERRNNTRSRKTWLSKGNWSGPESFCLKLKDFPWISLLVRNHWLMKKLLLLVQFYIFTTI